NAVAIGRQDAGIDARMNAEIVGIDDQSGRYGTCQAQLQSCCRPRSVPGVIPRGKSRPRKIPAAAHSASNPQQENRYVVARCRFSAGPDTFVSAIAAANTSSAMHGGCGSQ